MMHDFNITQNHVIFMDLPALWDGGAESGVPVNENHVFRLASISKWVAGVLSLKLEEQGQINLNVKTKDCLPGAPTQHSSRVVDLLTCRAGIRHYGGTTSPSSPTNWSNTVFKNDADAQRRAVICGTAARQIGASQKRRCFLSDQIVGVCIVR